MSRRIPRSVVAFLASGLALASGLLISCAERPVPPAEVEKPEAAAEPGGSTRRLAPAVSCADAKDCLAGVAMVTVEVAGSELPRVCTGTLLERDVLLTASSCLPEELRESGATCARQVAIFFPQAGPKAAETLGCATVLRASALPKDEHRLAPDFAFLKLSRSVDREPIPVDDSGIPSGEAYQVFGVSELDQATFEGKLRTVRCTSVQKNILLPSYSSDFAAMAAVSGSASDCLLSPFHAGAPVLEPNGRVRAIIQSAYREGPEAGQMLKELLRDGMAQFGFASNLACIATPSAPDRMLPPRCKQNVPAPIYAPGDKVISDAELAGAMAELESAVASQPIRPEMLSWKPSRRLNGSQFVYIPVPECIQEPRNWIDGYREPWYKGGDILKSAIERVELPSWRVEFSLTPELVLEYRVRRADSIRAQLYFSPAEVNASGKGKFRMRAVHPQELLFSAEIPLCRAKARP